MAMERLFLFESFMASLHKVAFSTQPDIPGRKPFCVMPSKYSFTNIWRVSILDSMAKKILPSQLERAIGRNFAGSDTLSLLAISVTEAHCQDRGMTPVFQTVSKMLKSRHLHRFQIMYGIPFEPGADLFLHFLRVF